MSSWLVARVELYSHIQAHRINPVGRRIQSVCVKIHTCIEFCRVLTDEPLELWVVVSSAIEIEAGSVLLAACVGRTVRGAYSAGRGVAERLVAVGGLECSRWVR